MTTPPQPRWSLGRRLVLLVVFGVVIPLSGVGIWTTRNAARSGEALLQGQLDSTLTSVVREIGQRWEGRQSDLKGLSENEPVRLALTDSLSTNGASVAPPPYVVERFASTSGIESVTLHARTGQVRWILNAPGAQEATISPDSTRTVVRTIPVRLPVIDLVSGDTIGALDAQLRAASLLPSLTVQQPAHGPLTAIFYGPHGALIPPAADEAVFQPNGIDHAGHRWLSVRQNLGTPDIDVVIAAMLDPYVAPFERSARLGAAALFGAALVIVACMVFAMRRVTRELVGVVRAAEAVSGGDLEQVLPVTSPDELGRIAVAFNAMTDSLRRTIRELAQKEALAAVGEFASELSHEVRNPLTSIRLDLQRVEELAGDATAVRGIVPRLLRQIERLDRAVTGALRVARGTRSKLTPVDIVAVVRSAMQTVESEYRVRDARLLIDPASSPGAQLDGDAAALEQIFVNLLINAAHALGTGGQTTIHINEADEGVIVTVADSGGGMSADQLSHVQEPFRSSKRDGTGLGLKIARRLVQAHGGRLEIESVLGSGTTVRVVLPRPARAATSIAASSDGSRAQINAGPVYPTSTPQSRE